MPIAWCYAGIYMLSRHYLEIVYTMSETQTAMCSTSCLDLIYIMFRLCLEALADNNPRGNLATTHHFRRCPHRSRTKPHATSSMWCMQMCIYMLWGRPGQHRLMWLCSCELFAGSEHVSIVSGLYFTRCELSMIFSEKHRWETSAWYSRRYPENLQTRSLPYLDKF